MIRDIMHYFGLSVSDFAKIMHTKRFTVFAWLSGKKEPKMKDMNKIKKMYSLIGEEDIFPIFYNYVEKPIGTHSKSLIEALSEPDFDEEEVKNMVDEIRKMSIERVKHIARDECRLTISEESKKKILNENLIIIYNGV